jgi:aminopeptidase-like protein
MKSGYCTFCPNGSHGPPPATQGSRRNPQAEQQQRLREVAYDVLQKCIECIETNQRLKVSLLCEPQLGKRGLYPTISTKKSGEQVRDMMNLLTYADGSRTTLEIAEKINVPMWELMPIVERLKKESLLIEV